MLAAREVDAPMMADCACDGDKVYRRGEAPFLLYGLIETLRLKRWGAGAMANEEGKSKMRGFFPCPFDKLRIRVRMTSKKADPLRG